MRKLKINRRVSFIKTLYLVFFALTITFNSIGQWNQLGGDIVGQTGSRSTGESVKLSGDGSVIAVGAPGYSNGINQSGQVQIYKWENGTWLQQGLDIEGEFDFDESGRSISLSDDGSIVAIGAAKNDGNGNNSGHVRVYQWNGNNWLQLGSDINGESADDWSGYATSLSADGSILAIGACRNSGNGVNSGHVRVYKWDGVTWSQQGLDIDGETADDFSGSSVSLNNDGNILAVGAMMNFSDSGKVLVYEWNNNSWVQKGSNIDGLAPQDRFGHSVSLNGDGSILAAGAYSSDGNGLVSSGQLRIFEWNGGAWVQKGQNINGQVSGDLCGYSVSLSENGLTVAVGSRNSEANGIGQFAGQVRVFEWLAGMWTQKEQDINGETINEYCGRSVDISADGSVIGIGSPGNSSTLTFPGRARVFSSCNDSINTTTNVSGLTFSANQTGATYQWLINCNNGGNTIPGATNSSYTTTTNGSYAVQIVVGTCVDTSACINVLYAELTENTFKNEISIFPNPTNGKLDLDFGDLNEELTIKLFNLSGQLLETKHISKLSQTEWIVQQSAGVYLLEITGNKNEKAVFRVIKE